MAHVEIELDPSEWAAELFKGGGPWESDIAAALAAAIERGRRQERERCIEIVHKHQIAFCSDACGWALDNIKDGLPADAVRVAK